MKKILKSARNLALAVTLLLVAKNQAQITQVFSLNTGVNSSNALLPTGATDPKWQVKFPNTSNFVPAYVASVYSWGEPSASCGRWISPGPLNITISSPNQVVSTITGPGLYTYRMNFTPTNCNIISAKIVFNYTLADNTLMNFMVNNNFTFSYPFQPYNCSPDIAQSCWIPQTPYTVNLNSTNFVAGNNTIDFTVLNNNITGGAFSITGLALCAYLEITYENALAASITGASNFCLGDPLTFVGSDGPNATASNYQWNIQECTSNGTPITPPNSWVSPMYSGTPGAFTFPTLPMIECGKYYLVGLSVANSCYINSISKIIYVKCPPVVRFVKDQTICKGSCVTLFATLAEGCTYNWYAFLDEPTYIGSGTEVVVCPNQTTNYSCIITDPVTGCSTIKYVTVTVESVDPNFSVSALTTNNNYMTIAATPNQISGLAATFSYLWLVEELDANNNVVWSVTNPSCWWNFPNTVTNNFSGLLGLTQTYNTNCTPSIGQFKYNTVYRITRGVWSENCPYKQSALIINYNQRGLVVANDPKAQDASFLINNTNRTINKKQIDGENTLTIYPNPSNSMVNVDYTLPKNSSGKLVITDLLGRTLQSIDLSESNYTNTFNLNTYQNGIYFVNLFVNNNLIKTEKIILSK